MRSKTIVITGASDGIGAAAARQLAADGHRLIVVGRSPDKTKAVAKEVGAQPIVADFARLDDVRRVAAEVLDSCEQVDVLANNAGLMGPSRRTVTVDGHELSTQVDYLAPFLLTHLLRDRLIASRATVIATSSLGHWAGRLILDDLDHEQSYSGWQAYTDAKLALLVHTRELQRRYGRQGLSAVAFHPGLVSSHFASSMGPVIKWLYHSPVFRMWPMTPARAAGTLVYLAEGVAGVDFRPGGYVSRGRAAATRRCVADLHLGDSLWQQTMRLLGLD